MGKGTKGENCVKRDQGRGLRRKGSGEGTVWERGKDRGLRGKGRGERTV